MRIVLARATTPVSSVILVVLAWIAGGCADARDPERARSCLDYDRDVQPALNDACVACHGPDTAEGSYRLDSYAAALAVDASGRRRAVAGSEASPVLRAARGEDGHPVAPEVVGALLSRWVVECNVSYFRTDAVHPITFVDPSAEDFHGVALRNSDWRFEACESCHGAGDDPAGGKTGLSCVRCHENGPTACQTCHGSGNMLTQVAPPPDLDDEVVPSARGVGAHGVHVNGGSRLQEPVACEECHSVPEAWDDVGHILLADGTADPAPAEIVFGEGAALELEGFSRRAGSPFYDATSGSCGNIGCHGAAVADPTAASPILWTEQRTKVDQCELCHGVPPATGTHSDWIGVDDCIRCHPAAYDGSGALAAGHIDGIVSVGNGSGDCTACHGGGEDPAPPRDLDGNTVPTFGGVGAHQQHLRSNFVRGPMPCNTCHQVPEESTSPGHIDTPGGAEVFRDAGGDFLEGLATVEGSEEPLAAARSAQPRYDPASKTCTNVACHGSGSGLFTDDSPTVVRTLRWTDVGNSTIFCGACHGLPPDNLRHPVVAPNIGECGNCHVGVFDSAGILIRDVNGQTKHINGRVEFF